MDAEEMDMQTNSKMAPTKNIKRLFFRKSENTPPYEVVPAMRPVFIIGPSLRCYEISELLQKALLNCIQRKFEGRSVTRRVTADLSLAKNVEKISPLSLLLEVRKEVEDIFHAASLLKLVLVDCPYINHPAQLAKTALAPIQVHIKIDSQEVLQKLIKSRGKFEKKHIGVQLVAAEKLNSCAEMFDVVLWESDLEEAGNHVCDYLEAYWRATHPDV